jgi:hypothetical protein
MRARVVLGIVLVLVLAYAVWAAVTGRWDDPFGGCSRTPGMCGRQ